MKTNSKNSSKEEKKSISVTGHVHSTFSKHQTNYKFKSQSDFVSTMMTCFVSNHPDYANYHPDKIVVDNRHVRTILKHFDKGNQSQLISISDFFIKYLLSEEEKNRKTNLNDGLNYVTKKIAEIHHVVVTTDKDKEIIRLREMVIKLQHELKKFRGDS